MRESLADVLGARTNAARIPFGFGAANLGNLYRAVDDETARACVDTAWERGIRYFDTAPHYGLGLSEERLGAALAEYPRDEFVLSTKVGRLLVPNPAPTGSDLAGGAFAVPDDLTRSWDFSAGGVRRSLEDSLTRLGLDRIDIVLVHDPDEHADEALAGAFPELVRMRDEGLVQAIGVGMNQWQLPLRFVQESDLNVVMLAGRFTLLDRSGLPLLEECARRRVAVLAAAPFNSGVLAKDDPSPQAHFNYAPVTPSVLEVARRLAQVARNLDVTLPQAALQFPLRHQAVTTVVSGIGQPRYVSTSLDWLGAPVPDEFWSAADAIVQAAGPLTPGFA